MDGDVGYVGRVSEQFPPGYMPLQLVASELRPKGHWNEDMVRELAADDTEERFSLGEDKDGVRFIRANWGHSFEVDLDLMFDRPVGDRRIEQAQPAHPEGPLHFLVGRGSC